MRERKHESMGRSSQEILKIILQKDFEKDVGGNTEETAYYKTLKYVKHFI